MTSIHDLLDDERRGPELRLNATSTVPWNDSLPTGSTADAVYFGRGDMGMEPIQIAIATMAARPTKGMLQELWRTRAGRRSVLLIAVAIHDGDVWFLGPDEKSDPIGPMTLGQGQRQLQSLLDEPHAFAAIPRLDALRKAAAAGSLGGWTNNGLFATYHLRERLPHNRDEWALAKVRAEPLLGKRGRALVEALGFTAEQAPGNALVLKTATGTRRAVAILLNQDDNFDQKSSTYQLTPVAFGLQLARQQGVPWLVMLRQDQLRLYPGEDGVGIGAKGQTETFFEIDLAAIDEDYAALLPLIFSATALGKGGSTEEILADSGRYAIGLGERLRDRIYEGVVPGLSTEIAKRLPEIGLTLDPEGLKTAYALTLRILFRLLFQAYGEDRGFLPSGRNVRYDANSLKALAARDIDTLDADFSDTSLTIWRDLLQVWEVIEGGDPQWEVPAYGGVLFERTTREGQLIEQLRLPNSVLGPALQHLLNDVTEDGNRGPVDFRSLSVREFGTIYEGLLESALTLAPFDLAEHGNLFIPARPDDKVVFHAGEPYFHSASGERKATGSYFTPKVIVDHLIDRSVEPAITEHLDRIKALVDAGKDREAYAAFFDFRVADLAMGSAHFLVAAVDRIEARMRDFLTVTDVPGVRAELQRLAEKAKEALGADERGKDEVDEVSLLRRQIARRCIYGLDVNPLAVELSQLALWIHTFVPGLPMSSLDHGLVLANSLTGIGTVREALNALDAGPLFEAFIREPLNEAAELLTDYANAFEADTKEVARNAAILAATKEAAKPAKAIFDVAVARRLGATRDEVWDAESFAVLATTPEIRAAIDPLHPAHLPYLFPEVFLRERPGFDVLLGNPPWESSYVKEDRWWNMRFPGLILLDDDEKTKRIEQLRHERPDLLVQYDAELEAQDRMRDALLKHGWPGLGSGHVDLYQAFAWRNWDIVRNRGRIGLALPRSAHSGSGLGAWRREVIDHGEFVSVCFIENTGRWAFDMEPRYTIGLTVIERSPGNEVKFAGPFTSENEFRTKVSKLAAVPVNEFKAWTDTAAFLTIPDASSVDVFRVMKSHPNFVEGTDTWLFRPTRGDLLSWKDIKRAESGGVALRTGRSFKLWEPDAAPARAILDASEFRRRYLASLNTSSRNRRSAHFGQSFELTALPIDQPRIVTRWISRATDSRTCIATLLPPGSATDDSASVFHRLRGGVREEAFVLGVLSSIPFDWQVRLLTEMNLTFEVLNTMGFPPADFNSKVSSRVIEIAGRLTAVDARYRDWATEIGVEIGTARNEPERSDLIAELDALVSLLYGLSRKQVEHVFATFHRRWDHRPRLAAVLTHYDAWKDA